MIDQTEIISSLAPINGLYFHVSDLSEYAKKVATFGKSIELRQEQTNELTCYVLYYDNRPEIFITMVWTHPDYQGRGFAKRLLKQLIHSSHKEIRLEVHKDNPALKLYESLGFVLKQQSGDIKVLCRQKIIAIMQPYTFPYIGYFHLIEACDLFVFYDDVHFIKQGWIHRNRILLNGKDHRFTIPVSHRSSNRAINDTPLSIDDKWKKKFETTLICSYQKAPFFSSGMDLITSVFSSHYENVSDLAINSIVRIYEYLRIPFNFTKSSVLSPDTRGMEKADRLIEICKTHGYKRYVNLAGGIELYSKGYFRAKGVELAFIKSAPVQYKQFSNEFVPWLSIIDVIMFNDASAVKHFLGEYKVT